MCGWVRPDGGFFESTEERGNGWVEKIEREC